MTFVLRSGRMARLNTMPTYGPPIPTSVQMGPNLYMTYESLWRTQPALRTVVDFLARNIAQLGIHLYRRKSDSDRERVTDHPFDRLMREPLPGTPWTHYRLIDWTIHELAIYDTAYWVKGKSDGGLPALMPMPYRYIRPVGDNPLFCDTYEINGTNGTRQIPADQIVHFHGYNPIDMRMGVSPIESLRLILAEEMAAAKYREQLWSNGARVQGYIARPADAPQWSGTARERFRADWNQRYSGGAASEAGGTPLLEDGMEFHASGVTPKDAQYIEARKLTREEVAIAYHIPPAMLGVIDSGEGSAALAELHQMFYQDALPPWLTQLEQDMENQLLPDLDTDGSLTGNLYIEFNINEKLRGSFESQAAALQAAVGGPWMTRGEARGRFNLPELPETDELIVPLNVLSGGLASPRDTAPDSPSNEESNGKPPGPKPVTSGR